MAIYLRKPSVETNDDAPNQFDLPRWFLLASKEFRMTR